MLHNHYLVFALFISLVFALPFKANSPANSAFAHLEANEIMKMRQEKMHGKLKGSEIHLSSDFAKVGLLD